MTPHRSRRSRSLAVLAVLGACAAPCAVARAAAVATTAAPAVSDFTFRPATLHPHERGAFRFLTSREGAGSIVIARLTSTGRILPVGRLRFAVDAGEGRKSFDGRLGGKALHAGRYRATVTVTNADTGPSRPRRVTFRVAAAV